jgi:hypothetical protein
VKLTSEKTSGIDVRVYLEFASSPWKEDVKRPPQPIAHCVRTLQVQTLQPPSKFNKPSSVGWRFDLGNQ